MDENTIGLIKTLVDEKIVSLEDEVYIRKILEDYKIQQQKVIESINEILTNL